MAQGLKGSPRAAPDVLVKGRSCQEKRPSLLELNSVTKLKKARDLFIYIAAVFYRYIQRVVR